MQVARKKVKQGSIFALPRRAKFSIEAEEPTSPKVSCMGQVRTSKKNKFSDNRAGESQHYKSSSASPARFFSSPGGQPKWGSLFRLRKDAHCAAPSSLGYCGGEVSCFGSPRNLPSGYNPERSCSAFFAKSLLLLQECEERAGCSKSEVAQMHSHAHAPHAQTHAHAHNDAVEKQIKSIVPTSSQFACEQGNAHTLRVADTLSEPMIIQQKETCAHETLTDNYVHKNLSYSPNNLCDAMKHVQLLNGVCDEIVMGSSRDHLRKAEGEEDLTSSSCDDGCLSYGDEALKLSSCNKECSLHDATDCHRHEVSSCQSQFTATHSSTSNVTMLEDDITCRAFESEDGSCSALKEEENANIEILDRADEQGTQGYDLRHCEEHAEQLEASDHVLSSSYTCKTHNWENCRMPLPQLCEKDLHCFLRKGTPCVWRAHGAPSGDTFLLLEYNLSKSFAWSKEDRDKVVISEVGEASFHGARRQLHWLEGEAKLIRSRSATSYRTVIQLQRCKSEPGRSY